jgi:hypothetical protein
VHIDQPNRSAPALAFRRLIHIGAVLVHELSNPFATLAGARPRILDRATQPHIIAQEILAAGLALQVIDVGLFDLELPGGIAPIVRLLPI